MWRALLLTGLAAVILCRCASPSLAQRRGAVKPVKGIVVNEQGEPLSDTEVLFPFTKQVIKKTKTDREGRFAFDHQFGGTASLIVARSEEGAKQGIAGLPWDVKNWNGEEARIVLKPAEGIRVRVVDSNSRPIAGAKAGALIHYQGLGSYKVLEETNAEGDASFSIPSGTGAVSFLALKSGAGLDYVNYGDYKESVKIPAKVTLQLTGAQSFEIDVVDGTDKPLADVQVHVWLASKPNSSPQARDDINLGYFADELGEISNSAGKVRFDWLPEWDKHMTTMGELAGYSYGQLNTRLDDENPASKLVMLKTARVSGRVLLVDGAPAENAEVTLTGQNFDLNGIHTTALTNSKGEFVFDTAPHHLCMIIAKSGKLVSRHVEGFVTNPAKPVEGLELKLEPGIRVYGKVTNESDKEPAKGVTIMLQKIGRKLEDFPGVMLPEPRNQNLPFRKSVGCQIADHVQTNESGEYEFFTSPGHVSLAIRLKASLEQADELYEKFELTNEKERRRDFVVPINAEPR